jgi:thymidylate synthase/dihydrofolate reductase
MNCILCCDLNGGIGFNNSLPWNVKSDMKNFRETTINKTVIMGRKTWDSLKNKPLKDRRNIVVTNSVKPENKEVEFINIEQIKDTIKDTIEEKENTIKDTIEKKEDTIEGKEDTIKDTIEGKEDTIWIIGGITLIDSISENIQRYRLTVLKKTYTCDTFISPSSNLFQILQNIKNTFMKKYNDLKTHTPEKEQQNSYSIKKIFEDEDCCIFDCEDYYKSFATFPKILRCEENILNIIRNIQQNGFSKIDRTNTGRTSIYCQNIEFQISHIENDKIVYYLPLQTVKKVSFPNIFSEIMWMIRGQTNSKILESQGNNIWKVNAKENGDCGPVYGFQWRNWGGDKLVKLINGLKKDPFSTRHILSSWNESDLDKMCLPPCISFIQFYVTEKDEKKYLSLHYFQRSCDVALAMNWNLSSMCLLNILIASVTDLIPLKVNGAITDAHIYNNHIDKLPILLSRLPLKPPTITILNKKQNIEDYELQDILIENYFSYPHINFKLNN